MQEITESGHDIVPRNKCWRFGETRRIRRPFLRLQGSGVTFLPSRCQPQRKLWGRIRSSLAWNIEKSGRDDVEGTADGADETRLRIYCARIVADTSRVLPSMPASQTSIIESPIPRFAIAVFSPVLLEIWQPSDQHSTVTATTPHTPGRASRSSLRASSR